MSIPENGFIYVASKDKQYYEYALYSCDSLKLFYPSSHVTLFTHDAFLDKRADIFDNIVTNIPVHPRAKMWCMARTPYQRTFYNDVDSQIVSSKIKNVFDEMDDCDMFFTGSYWHTTSSHRWAFFDIDQKIPVEYHGAVCGYRKTDLTIDFMQTWFDEYVIQRNSKDWPYKFAYKEWQQFDMFTLWRLTSGRFPEFDRFKDLKIKTGPKIYNATIEDGKDTYDGKKPIVYQIDRGSIKSMSDVYKKMKKGIEDERSLPKKPKNSENSIWYN